MKISLSDQLAIRLGNTFATWTFVGFQLLVISVWILWDPFHNPERVYLDLAVSIWTLILDCVILISQRQASKELARNTEATAKTAVVTVEIAERMIHFLEEEKRVHKKMQESQDRTWRKINESDID